MMIRSIFTLKPFEISKILMTSSEDLFALQEEISSPFSSALSFSGEGKVYDFLRISRVSIVS